MIIFYDKSDYKLGFIWAAGAVLYRTLGWAEQTIHGEIGNIPPEQDIQIWCHGGPGSISWNEQILFAKNLAECFVPLKPKSIWFRTCAFAHGRAGRESMRYLHQKTGAIIAGHTYNIGQNLGQQSGLRVYPHPAKDGFYWPSDEGLSSDKLTILSSSASQPATVNIFTKDFRVILNEN